MHRPLPADVKAVLFDLDGTLIETDNRWAAQLGKRLAPLRRVAPWWDTGRAARDVIMMIEGPSNYAVAIIERLGLSHLVSELADRVRRSKGLATRDTSELVPGSEQVLEATSQRFKLGVVTTRARREALAFLERWDFAKYFGGGGDAPGLLVDEAPPGAGAQGRSGAGRAARALHHGGGYGGRCARGAAGRRLCCGGAVRLWRPPRVGARSGRSHPRKTRTTAQLSVSGRA